jgi:Ca2+-binding RTX toxin-like protein
MKRLLFASVLAVAMTLPANAFAGHGLSGVSKLGLDHPAPAFVPPAPPATTVNSGGEGAEWEVVSTVATGNPHTDIDFFTQSGEMYVSAGTLGAGLNAGGQTIVQLTDGGEVSPQFVSAHPSAACISNPNAALGLQHDIEATPKGDAPLNVENPFADRRDTQLLIDATDAPGRCHDNGTLGILGVPRGGLEIIDVTDVANPVEIGLTSHIGEAHTVNVDPKRPHIAYAVTSDSVAVTADGERENEDPSSTQRFRLDGFEIVDLSSCMDFPPETSLEEKRDACRPEVYRYRYPTKEMALGHTLQTGGSAIFGCHELEIYPNDLITCGSGNTLIGLDLSAAFDDNGTPNDFTDDKPRGEPLPCRVRGSTSLAPLQTGAMITDCVFDEGGEELTIPRWLNDLGAPSLEGVEWLGSIHHQGRGAGGSATPAFDSTEDIDFNHEAELTASGDFLLATDERGGGVVPPGASCSPGFDNTAGNGGIHAYRFDGFSTDFPASPEEAFEAYAQTPEGEKAIHRVPIRTGPQASLCTAHVFQQIPGQNRIFMGWYTQGTQVVDFVEHPDGTFEFREAGWFIPEDANTWVSHVFDWEENDDGTFTYWGATGDFFLGTAGRSAIDVYKVTLPAPPTTTGAPGQPQPPDDGQPQPPGPPAEPGQPEPPGAAPRCRGKRATIVGTPGDDVLPGTARRDVIVARGGDDLVRARRGPDLVCAGPGDDVVNGGKGRDRLFGGKGADALRGGPGKDVLAGGGGQDRLVGKRGDDVLRGGKGADVLRAGRGDDLLRGGPGNDVLRGGPGGDVIRPGGRRDRINCGPGRDVVSVDPQRDRWRNCEVVRIRKR